MYEYEYEYDRSGPEPLLSLVSQYVYALAVWIDSLVYPHLKLQHGQNPGWLYYGLLVDSCA